jgi:hypothetical protein
MKKELYFPEEFSTISSFDDIKLIEFVFTKKLAKNALILVYNDHPPDPKFLVVVERWSLFRGSFMP